MQRRHRIPRLTDEQRDRASDPVLVERARKFAGRYARRYPWVADEIESAGLYALLRAVATHKPAWGPFDLWLYFRVRREVIDALRMQLPQGFRRGDPDAVPWPVSLSVGADGPLDGRTDKLTVGDCLAADELPVGWELESADEVKRLVAALPAKYAVAFRLCYLHAACETQKATAAALGCHESNVTHMFKRGAAELRTNRVRA